MGNEPKDWEIYRGDSFQLIINPVDVTRNCLVNQGRYQTTHKTPDVRSAIGVGTVDYTANKVTESNGTAFVNSENL
jgi:hypothetical protein